MSEAERGGASRRDESGRLLAGRYRLGGVLGRGGMGTVWRAKDETLGRTVAVKELRFPSSIDEDEKRRLITRTLREAKAIARIRNNGAVTVFDVVDEDDRPWIVMELIEGKSLAEVIREDGLLEPKRAAEVGLAILDVLRAAHREGILHRDVKPSNVLISKEDGRVVLTDFGIAQVEGDPSITSTGMLVGAPSYISPERARGHKPGPAADLWSLGGLLYAAVEGVPPYDKGSAIATLTAVMTEPVPEPKSAGPLKDVIYGLLAKDPQQRLDEAGARALLNKVIHAPEPKPAEPEPMDATRVVALPPAPEERSGKAGSGGSGSGTKPGEVAERWRGALRSMRKAATGAAAGTAAAGTRGRADAEEASGAATAGAEAASERGSGAGPERGSGTGAKTGSERGAGPGSERGSGGRSDAGSDTGAGSGSEARAGSGAGAGAGAGTAVAGKAGSRSGSAASGSVGSGSVASGAAATGQAGGSGGQASRGQAAGAHDAATQVAGSTAGGRTSGWPEVPPPDLPPRPVPRAPITDVVPRRTLIIIAVAVAVVVLGTVLALTFGDDSGSDSSSRDTRSAASSGVSASSSTDEDSGTRTEADKTEPASSSGASASGSASAESGAGTSSGSGSGGNSGSGGGSGSDDIAEKTYKSTQGFSIGLPKGWKYQSTDAAGARFTGPDGQKLLVAWTSTPPNDPVADWKSQERYMTRSQYQRIRIEEVDFRDWKTADWEFTYVEGGTKYRTIDRGFIVNSHQGHALMYTAKASKWGSELRKDTWRTFTKTFKPKS
ncbi:serine/threonine-protein kinase [Streptomyces phyllanthi]|uniref:non-specific serine/threonine protein kinase n=1 Tax=Streptomyces phyllanthi TaxID=1803180 RepID=A0A5N8W0V2_9ACTN|nr:serine/threonine-protein kinase [Streptomyces phyllanthi]MPY41131.1 serine/threonine protein kinase [Streptomyces phyllanthi]